MRKRQPLADAMALSSQISRIEATIRAKRLTLKDVDAIIEIAERVHALTAAKIVVPPPLLQRVRALQAVAWRVRVSHAQGNTP